MLDRDKIIQAEIDYDESVNRFAGNKGLYDKFLMRFREDGHCREAREALDRGDYEGVLGAAHTLKGLAGNMGMFALADACSVVVNSVRQEQYEKLEEQMQEMEKCYNMVMTIYE